jgi:hypothetical protein
MPQDQLRAAIDAIRTRLQDEISAQLTDLSDRHERELEAVRRSVEAEAEQRWASKVEAVRAEWTSRLDAEVNAARQESERRMVAESMRIRVEAEQAAAESASKLREELENALSAERQRAQEDVAAERTRAQQELAAERARWEQERAAERERHVAELATRDQEHTARAAERQSHAATLERVLTSVRAIDRAGSLTDTLSALVRAASNEASRAALFVINGSAIQALSSAGFNGASPDGTSLSLEDAGVLGEAARRGDAVRTGDGVTAPGFAQLGPDRRAIAVPIVIDSAPVAVLYADDAGTRETTDAAWVEAIQILGRHAAGRLAHVTAVRTAQAMRMGTQPAGPANGVDDENSARRYARLLLSEIKLYNEGAVRVGRERRDLRTRLGAEIDRARRLYEERVPSSVASRDAHFEEELAQTLADGDPSLLGGSR